MYSHFNTADEQDRVTVTVTQKYLTIFVVAKTYIDNILRIVNLHALILFLTFCIQHT